MAEAKHEFKPVPVSSFRMVSKFTAARSKSIPSAYYTTVVSIRNFRQLQVKTRALHLWFSVRLALVG